MENFYFNVTLEKLREIQSPNGDEYNDLGLTEEIRDV